MRREDLARRLVELVHERRGVEAHVDAAGVLDDAERRAAGVRTPHHAPLRQLHGVHVAGSAVGDVRRLAVRRQRDGDRVAAHRQRRRVRAAVEVEQHEPRIGRGRGG